MEPGFWAGERILSPLVLLLVLPRTVKPSTPGASILETDFFDDAIFENNIVMIMWIER